MNQLIKEKVSGYFVRKRAVELKRGDVAIIDHRVFEVLCVWELESGRQIKIECSEGTSIIIKKSILVECIQKEDPVVQIANEAKLKVLRKHNGINMVNSNHEVLKTGALLTTSSEWIKYGSPHQWSIIETEGKYEYWEDSAYEIKVLWSGNKIIAWNDCKKKPLSMYMLKSKEGVCVFDAPTYDLPKYIWR
jgi:hypothetical protein